MIDNITKNEILVRVEWKGQTVDMLTAYCDTLINEQSDIKDISDITVNTDAYTENTVLNKRMLEVNNFISHHHPQFENEKFANKYAVFCDITTKQYRSTRHNFNEQVDDIARFQITASMLLVCLALASLKLISVELTLLAAVILTSTIIQCVISWLRPAHFYTANNDNHKQTIITKHASLVASALWRRPTDVSPSRHGETSYAKLRDVIADVLLSSPYGRQELLTDLTQLPDNEESRIIKGALESHPLHNVKNTTPILSPIKWLTRSFLETCQLDIHKPRSAPANSFDQSHSRIEVSHQGPVSDQTSSQDLNQSNRV